MIYVHALVCRLKMLLKQAWDLEIYRYPGEVKKLIVDEAYLPQLKDLFENVDTTPSAANASSAVITSDACRLLAAKAKGAYTVAVIGGESAAEWKALGADCNIPSAEHFDELVAFLRKIGE